MNYITEPQKNIPLRYKADIFVAGGSCTGVFAAVRAARLRVMVNLNQLGEAAGIMGKGMLGVFVVIGVLILCIYALNSAGKKKKKKDEDNK